MNIMSFIGEGLLYVVALPICSFQCVEMLISLVEVSGDIANSIHK